MCSLRRSTVVLKIDPKNPDDGVIARAAELIKSGRLVAFPTETVYGLAANLLDDKAVAELYKVKNRPRNKPFTVHISDTAQISKAGCHITADAQRLIGKFWPGPVTIVLASKNGATTGFRMPANKVALKLIEASGVPVIAPSANLSGNPAPTNAGMVVKDLDGKIDMVLDSGSTEVGIESTVVDLSAGSVKVLREGAVKANDIMQAING